MVVGPVSPWWMKWLHDRGLTIEDIQKEGAQIIASKIAFPVYSPSGQFLRFLYRNPDGLYPKWDWGEDEREHYKTFTNKILYGFPKASGWIKKYSEVIFVEGIADCLALWKIGYCNTVATLSSRVTTTQSVIPTRLNCDRVIILYDGDESGQQGAMQSVKDISSLGIYKQVIAAAMPEGFDPASAVYLQGSKIIDIAIARAYQAVEEADEQEEE